VIIACKATRPATDLQVAVSVSDILQQRSEMAHPPVSLAIPDDVALGIADIFRSPTPSGLVFDRFRRTGAIDAAQLIEAAETEQHYASPEGHAALYCLIGWVRARVLASERQARTAR
jgi:hypothetical protein